MDRELTNADLKSLISRKLTKLSADSKQTIEESGRDLGMDYSEYYRLLKGIRLPHLLTLLKINQKYGVSMDWWFNDMETDNKKNTAKIAEFELVNNFKKLDEQAQNFISEILRSLVRNRKQEKTKK
jgi:transcriptional regulator with XRE-family HTH domain